MNTSYNWSYGQDVINTVEHELSEGGLGRLGGLGDQNSFWSVIDLFRYNPRGRRTTAMVGTDETTYFSFTGGATSQVFRSARIQFPRAQVRGETPIMQKTFLVRRWPIRPLVVPDLLKLTLL